MKVKNLFRDVTYPIKLYNEHGKIIYIEYSDGFWAKWEYDAQGLEIYYEDSTGYIEDKRPKSKTKTKTIIIDGKEIRISQESFKQLKDSLGV